MFSDPVVGERFFGREEPLNLLAKRVSGLKDGYRQNIAILGPKLSGKSSLILHFFSSFKHHKIIPIYVALQPNSFNGFIYKFIGALLYHYLKNKDNAACPDRCLSNEVNEELENLKQSAQDSIPKTVEVIRSVEDNLKTLQFDRAYQSTLSLTSILKEESGLSTVVILDGFHLLDKYKIKNPFASLAKEIMMQKDTMYIFISSQISSAKKILANDLALLFGKFEIIHLEHFNYITCCKFLEKRFQEIRLPHNFRDFLIAFSEGHPFYLDILSNKLLEVAKQSHRTQISAGLISETFNALTYDSQGILNQYFTSLLSHNLNGADYANFLPILLAASSKGVSLGDISRATNRPFRLIAKQIEHLLDTDLVLKLGVFYRIQDQMFRFWLKSVYRQKTLSLTANPAAESRQFSKKLEEEISGFAQETKKEIIEKIIDLFKCFRNESIVLQNKSFKFWHFEDIRLWSAADVGDCIICRYKGGYWACLIRKNALIEQEVQRFFQACKGSRLNIRKMIIIALKELELNARLAALEKKIWIWPRADLNSILDLYGRRQIVN